MYSCQGPWDFKVFSLLKLCILCFTVGIAVIETLNRGLAWANESVIKEHSGIVRTRKGSIMGCRGGNRWKIYSMHSFQDKFLPGLPGNTSEYEVNLLVVGAICETPKRKIIVQSSRATAFFITISHLPPGYPIISHLNSRWSSYREKRRFCQCIRGVEAWQ